MSDTRKKSVKMMLDEDRNSVDNVDQDVDQHDSEEDVQPMRKKARKANYTPDNIEDEQEQEAEKEKRQSSDDERESLPRTYGCIRLAKATDSERITSCQTKGGLP